MKRYMSIILAVVVCVPLLSFSAAAAPTNITQIEINYVQTTTWENKGSGLGTFSMPASGTAVRAMGPLLTEGAYPVVKGIEYEIVVTGRFPLSLNFQSLDIYTSSGNMQQLSSFGTVTQDAQGNYIAKIRFIASDNGSIRHLIFGVLGVSAGGTFSLDSYTVEQLPEISGHILDMQSVTPVTHMPTGYVTPEYYHQPSAVNNPNILLYSPSNDVYVHAYFQGNCILTPNASGGYRVDFTLLNNTSLFVLASDCVVNPSYSDSAVLNQGNMESSTAYYGFQVLRPYDATAMPDTDKEYYQANRYRVDANNNNFRMDGLSVGDWLPVAVGLRGSSIISYSTGARYVQTGQNIVLNGADTLPQDKIYRISLERLNKYMTYVGFQPYEFDQATQDVGTDIGGVGTDIGDWADQAGQYQQDSEKAVADISDSMIAFSPLFMGVFNAMPSWYYALLAVVLAVVIGRKILGR